MNDAIYFCSPKHTGTHFLRFLLELHPQVSFWVCGRTMVNGWCMADWQLLCERGYMTSARLWSRVTRAPSDFPDWTLAEADRLGIVIPEKGDSRPFFHVHVTESRHFWYPDVRTIVTVRDPLLSVIGALRRGSVEAALGIVGGFRFLSGLEADACFWFCTDLWATERDRALGVLDYLGLERTPEIEQFVARWPALNSTSDGRFTTTDRPELVEARQWAVKTRRVHPAVRWWAEQLRAAGIQPLLERLGYRELAWFE